MSKEFGHFKAPIIFLKGGKMRNGNLYLHLLNSFCICTLRCMVYPTWGDVDAKMHS